MLKTLKDAWKVLDIRKRIGFTLLMIVVFRLGNAIPVPFMDKAIIKQIMSGQEGGIVSLLNLLSGGSLRQMSIFALSIYPYITASIILQLLTVAFPRLGELTREGEEGKKRMGKYTKICSIILAFIQGYATVNGLFNRAIVDKSFLTGFVILISLVAGSMFLVWLGEMITERGIGNGISILIFIGIISNMPRQIGTMIYQSRQGMLSWWKILLFVLIAIIILVVVVLINQGERRIPVQYAKRVVGRKMYGGQSTHIPIKVNMGGVMPVIFASAILQLPQTIALLFGKDMPLWLAHIFTVQTTSGLVIFSIVNMLLIIIFAFFYSAIQFNTVEYAKNLQQYGGFIMGIRPGKPTGMYLKKISDRVTFIGAIILAIVASAPMLISKAIGIQILFGGTSIIIVVGVVLDTVKQMESMLTMKHYKGFLK
ncbi:MAG: preprotein translocase subunit SecY [Finegoldia magna]|uniref:preprotein translocase subunit SecY n=1 Tax=Finegoldia magna TaxID=1260 RepID=UPI00288B3D5F|nr:preprotein translocase subunit SecY [Finegoldia magna]MDU2897600.1 preprotein translocase subunit SecY [Finegoldia magna]MDU5369334.1 preprotein translocase subunit SecY [Finegoldia magna]MDU5443548.1 preprotein translocase subunit SecY [Finegoldia magna]